MRPLALFVLLTAADLPAQVIATRAMRDVILNGQGTGVIAMDSLTGPGLYGVGPLEHLRGEITVVDGVCHVARVINHSVRVSVNRDVRAPFFVHARVERWEPVALPDDVVDLAGLDALLTDRSGADPGPFAFRLVGEVDRPFSRRSPLRRFRRARPPPRSGRSDLARASKRNRPMAASVKSATSLAASSPARALTHSNFSRSDFSNAVLTRADASHSEFQGADFTQADLTRARLIDASCPHARFDRARLQQADARGPDFTPANFGAADVTRMNLEDADLSGADLRNARGLTQTQLNEACGDRRMRLPRGMRVQGCH